MGKSWITDKALLKKMNKLEKARMLRERAHNKRVWRTFILSCYGLSDPKDLPEECKKCSNFYCTFCFKCRHLTKKATDWDCYAPNEQETENYKAYEKLCNAIVREHTEVSMPSLGENCKVQEEKPL
jgi:hypothetical protein